jgi:hypothetical protein
MRPTFERLLDFFGDKNLSDINGVLCRGFASARRSMPPAKISWCCAPPSISVATEGLCEKIVSVVLPEKAVSRERWCTRSEIARMIWTAWRHREIQKRIPADRYSRRPVVRFILVAMYKFVVLAGKPFGTTPCSPYDLEWAVIRNP